MLRLSCIQTAHLRYNFKKCNMKTVVTLICSLLVTAIFACNDQLYRLSLNQRSFYNPAAMCPYCKGSPFLSFGMSFIPGETGRGWYTSFGNDGPNFVHGPWDFTYANSRGAGYKANAWSLRYAWAQPFSATSKWKVAAGFRFSYYSIKETVSETTPNAVTDTRYRAGLTDWDAGMMLTNTNGFYAGFSMQHLGSPQRTVHGENGFSHSIGLGQSYSAMTGYVQHVGKKWDLMPDVAWMKNDAENITEGTMMVRYNHHFAIGGGAVISSTEKTQPEIRGGYTSSKFKWLVSASPEIGTGNWSIETGIVIRFVQQECTGGACVVPTTRDDFLHHR